MRSLLTLAAVFVVAVSTAGSAAAEPGPAELPAGVVAFVEGVPPALGTVTDAEFHRSLAQAAAQAGVSPAPQPSDRRYRRFAEQGLEERLDHAWIIGQAAEFGIVVTRREIRKQFAAIKEESFESEAEYRRFLREAKLTEAEARERVKLQILSARIQEEVVRGVRSMKEAQQAFREFVEDYSERWRARTTCAERLATDHCSNGRRRAPRPASTEGRAVTFGRYSAHKSQRNR